MAAWRVRIRVAVDLEVTVGYLKVMQTFSFLVKITITYFTLYNRREPIYVNY